MQRMSLVKYLDHFARECIKQAVMLGEGRRFCRVTGIKQWMLKSICDDETVKLQMRNCLSAIEFSVMRGYISTDSYKQHCYTDAEWQALCDNVACFAENEVVTFGSNVQQVKQSNLLDALTYIRELLNTVVQYDTNLNVKDEVRKLVRAALHVVYSTVADDFKGLDAHDVGASFITELYKQALPTDLYPNTFTKTQCYVHHHLKQEKDLQDDAAFRILVQDMLFSSDIPTRVKPPHDFHLSYYAGSYEYIAETISDMLRHWMSGTTLKHVDRCRVRNATFVIHNDTITMSDVKLYIPRSEPWKITQYVEPVVQYLTEKLMETHNAIS